MTITKTGKYIIGGVLLSAIAVVGIYANRQIQLLQNSCFRLLGVRNLSVKNGLHGTITLGFKNMSDLSVDLIKQEYKLFINDYYVGDIKSALKASVKSHEETPIEIQIDIDPQKLTVIGVKNLANLLFAPEAIQILLQGTVTAKAGIVIGKNIRVMEQWTLKELLHPVPDPKSPCDTKKTEVKTETKK